MAALLTGRKQETLDLKYSARRSRGEIRQLSSQVEASQVQYQEWRSEKSRGQDSLCCENWWETQRAKFVGACEMICCRHQRDSAGSSSLQRRQHDLGGREISRLDPSES